MIKRIAGELKRHVPFTGFGAGSGIAIILVIALGGFLPQINPVSQEAFYVLHPTHVFLSALATTSIYMRFGDRCLWKALLIGLTGSLGITTVSDSVIPYLGETLLQLPDRGVHIGFIEKPLLTNPAAFLGIAMGYWRQTSKFPHFGHVLISTWASLFHVIMALGGMINWFEIVVIFVFLFVAVWAPCCTSDIVYPLIFTGEKSRYKFHHR